MVLCNIAHAPSDATGVHLLKVQSRIRSDGADYLTKI
jgi:hypothetical protein